MSTWGRGCLLACIHACALAGVGDQLGRVATPLPDKVQAGRVAFVDPGAFKLVEVDMSGKVTWEYSLPISMLGGSDLNKGTDVEWLADTDHFLLAIPGSGVFEVDRHGDIVWQYKTRFVDHDADRLSNGNTVFVMGWDGKTDPILTEVDPAKNVVWQLFAAQLELDSEDFHPGGDRVYSYTHANSARKLAEGEYLLSLRNFDQFLVWKDGKVTERVRARKVHDPVPYKGGYLFAEHLHDGSRLTWLKPDGKRVHLFRSDANEWHPLRTVELLRNGNILLTGSREVGQMNPGGEWVWVMTLDQFSPQRSRFRRTDSFLYKAAFVYR